MKRNVREYFEKNESKYGYNIVLKDAQHFGYYPNVIDNISEWEAQKNLHLLLTHKLAPNTNDYILDAGCGRGVVACDVANRQNIKILGIDITPYMIRLATQRAISFGLKDKIVFKECSYEQIPTQDATFDKAYTIETLSHATDLEKALSEIHRVLKPKGIAVFIEYEIAPFNFFNEYELKMYRLVKNGSAMNSLDKFIEGNFIKLLNKIGFKIIEDLDITKNRSKSMRRLYKLALIPYQIIKLLNLRWKFINTTAGVEFYKLNEKNLFKYHLYKVQKN